MAFFDPARQSLTLRLVYDGLGTAGKTTNVRQAHALFTLARRGDVFAPAEEHGRTLFFDWLELEAGVVDEHPLRCQVLTVPGQFLHVQRRYELLRSADAIVLVCDSSPPGVMRSRYAARFLRRMMDDGSCPRVPVVVQANKQDLPGALPPDALAAELDLGPDAIVVGANAAAGDGVRATLVFALQAAREELRARLRRDGLASLPVKRETPEQVYGHLLRHENDSDGAVLADAVIASFLDDDAPPVSVEGLGLGGAAAVAPAVAPAVGPVASPAVTDAPAFAPVAATPADDDLLPRPDPPPGSVWPPSLGPALVREAVLHLPSGARLPSGHENREAGPGGPGGPGDESGDSNEDGELELRAGDAWVLLTAPSLVFTDRDRARFALDEMASARTAASDFLPASTAFVLRAHAASGRSRLWAVRPAIAPLFDEAAGPPADAEARREALQRLASAAARAVALAARYGVVSAVRPGRVGVSAGLPVYLGLLRGPEALEEGFVASPLRWADRLGDAPLAELYGDLLRRALLRQTTPSDLSVIGFTRALAAFRPTTAAGGRLVEALRGL